MERTKCVIRSASTRTFSIPTVELVSGVIHFRHQLIYSTRKRLYQILISSKHKEEKKHFLQSKKKNGNVISLHENFIVSQGSFSLELGKS